MTRYTEITQELTGLMAPMIQEAMKREVHSVYLKENGSEVTVILVFKEKPKDDYPVKPDIHNRMLSVLRKRYNRIVLIEYDNVEDMSNRRINLITDPSVNRGCPD